MTFWEHLQIAQRLLMEKGVPNAEHGNNLHALLRLFGVPIRPPHFSGFGFNLAVYGFAYTIPAGLLACYGSERQLGFVGAFFTLRPFAGLLGLWKALQYSRLSKKHGLPAWSELHRPADVFD